MSSSILEAEEQQEEVKYEVEEVLDDTEEAGDTVAAEEEFCLVLSKLANL